MILKPEIYETRVHRIAARDLDRGGQRLKSSPFRCKVGRIELFKSKPIIYTSTKSAPGSWCQNLRSMRGPFLRTCETDYGFPRKQRGKNLSDQIEIASAAKGRSSLRIPADCLIPCSVQSRFNLQCSIAASPLVADGCATAAFLTIRARFVHF